MTLYLYYTLYYTQTLSRYINLSFIAGVAPSASIGNATLHRDSRGRAPRTRGKVTHYAAQLSTLHKDSRGRTHEREVK